MSGLWRYYAANHEISSFIQARYLKLLREDSMIFSRMTKSSSVEYAARCYFCGYERTDEKTKEIVAKMWERRLNDETD